MQIKPVSSMVVGGFRGLFFFLISLSPLLAFGQMADDTQKLSIDLAHIGEQRTGDLDEMIKSRNIRILTVYSKTFYHMDKGKLSGLTYEISRQFETYLNKKLIAEKKLKQKYLKVNVTLIPVKRDELLPYLNAGLGDLVIANMTVTDKRRAVADFTDPFFTNAHEIVVGAPGTPALLSAEELSGKTVFIRKSSSFYESVEALNVRLRNEHKPEVQIKIAPEMLESEDIMEMLNANLVQYSILDQHIADLWRQVYPKLVLSEKAIIRSDAHTAWAIRKNSPQLKKMMNQFLVGHRRGTKMGNIMITRYYKNANYLKDVDSKQERQKFLSVVNYFQKYGDKYRVDWLLMTAQGYQESQLNQAARSPSGAIGIMQVMPATGKQLGVGDITRTESNIHAGVKYMRWMIDQYYKDEPMTDLDKVLFSFASYNAGPRRIQEMRREAKRRRLDPNIWFQNVEYIAAEKIGYETVTYVSNIYKYYIAYMLIIEAQSEKAAPEKKLVQESFLMPDIRAKPKIVTGIQ